jgi:outer membrane protein
MNKTILSVLMMMLLVLVATGVSFDASRAQDKKDAPKKDPAPKVEAPAVSVTPASPGAAGADASCKVGFVNLARVLEESQEGKRLKGQLDGIRDKAMEPLNAKKKQLDDLQTKITSLTQEMLTKGSVWSDDEKLRRQNDLQNMQLQYNQLLQALGLERDKIQDDLMSKKGDILKPLEDKLNKIMEDVGAKGGYCIIFDVSPPNSNVPNFNPIIYRDPGRDITDQIIKAVDGK